MSKINEIGQQPQEINDNDNNLKGSKLFFGELESKLFESLGREITEEWLQQSFILYRIDLKKTNAHPLYGESKMKSYLQPDEIFGRIDVESKSPSYMIDGGPVKKGFGEFTAHVYLQHLDELGLLDNKDNQNMVLKIREGDFIGFKGQMFRIYDNGFSQINNKSAWAGDRRFYVSIRGKEVDEDQFNGR